MQFDDRFRNQAVAAAPVETADAGPGWGEYALAVAKIVGISFAGHILDAAIKGATGVETNFGDVAQYGSIGWYAFGPGAPSAKGKTQPGNMTRTPRVP